MEVTTAGGDQVRMIAVTGVVPGRDMPVIWVTRVDEYKRKGTGAHRIPWPAQFVRPVDAAASAGR
ncbi:hypothetical protein [Mycobacteroides abscessus]|uniref:hypothetical protein n=1 Tax=Mycobacteroides abscessus TaxID=36809 RepID=UPI0013FD2CA4